MLKHYLLMLLQQQNKQSNTSTYYRLIREQDRKPGTEQRKSFWVVCTWWMWVCLLLCFGLRTSLERLFNAAKCCSMSFCLSAVWWWADATDSLILQDIRHFSRNCFVVVRVGVCRCACPVHTNFPSQCLSECILIGMCVCRHVYVSKYM